MTNELQQANLEIRSTISREGRLELKLEEAIIPELADDEVLVRVEAAPINPADLLVLFGPASLATVEAGGSAARPLVTVEVPSSRLADIAARLGQSLRVGNEGAGVVVKAGRDVEVFLGRTVALRDGMFAHYRVARAADCMVFGEGVTPRQAASASINPMTVLAMVETMRREGHTALVHTAAASNLGQMLNRVCLADGIPLVNIVRNAEQVEILREIGASYVIDSTSPTFDDELTRAIGETGATLAFDAIGGGTVAATILTSMEKALTLKASTFSRYGSATHKQVYIYGLLDPGPKIIAGNMGAAWGVGGWLMSWYLQKLGADTVKRLRDRVIAEITTTFASRYTAELSLAEALLPEMIAAYTKRATGAKYLIVPTKAG
ncbi:MAG: zinc-binding dehydrogenase [Rhizobiaceae bacterium]|nr:zinc-binding dehydrogenase [Rhizobiaceae bacterium]